MPSEEQGQQWLNDAVAAHQDAEKALIEDPDNVNAIHNERAARTQREILERSANRRTKLKG